MVFISENKYSPLKEKSPVLNIFFSLNIFQIYRRKILFYVLQISYFLYQKSYFLNSIKLKKICSITPLIKNFGSAPDYNLTVRIIEFNFFMEEMSLVGNVVMDCKLLMKGFKSCVCMGFGPKAVGLKFWHNKPNG